MEKSTHNLPNGIHGILNYTQYGVDHFFNVWKF